MSIDAQSKSHVGKVSAALNLLCRETHPDIITERLGLQPTGSHYFKPPDIYFTPKGAIPDKGGGFWYYDTSSQILSRELAEHLRYLLKVFLPLKDKIHALRLGVCVRVNWESTIAGSDLAWPQIPADCIRGLAELGASLDIHVIKIGKVKKS